jgi:hypothetical protein
MRTGIAALMIAVLVSLLATSLAGAAPTQVNVRIEGKSETLFEGPVWTEGHAVKASSDGKQRSCDGINPNDPENLTPDPTPTAASADAMSIVGETFDGQWYNTYDDYFITRWGPDEQSLTEAAYWGILVNNVFTDVGGCQYEMNTGDEVLWVYDAFKARPFLALFPAAAGYTSGTRPLTATAELGKPFEVEVAGYADQAEDNPPAGPERAGSAPFADAMVSPVQTSAKGFEKTETGSPATVTTNAEGKASITFTEPGWHRIKATSDIEEEAAVPSNRLDVCVPASGKSGCGEPPLEDQTRTPPSTTQKEIQPESKESPTGGGTPSGEKPSPQTSVSPGTQPPAHPSGPAALLTLRALTAKHLILRLNVAGTATVAIARQQDDGHRRTWRTVRRVAVRMRRAGQIEVKIPRLPLGRYCVTISLPGAKSLVKTLTVSRG